MRHALTVMEECLGPNHVDVANHALMPLAGLLGDGLGLWPEANDTYLKAVRVYSRTLGRDHETTRATKKLADAAHKKMLNFPTQPKTSRNAPPGSFVPSAP